MKKVSAIFISLLLVAVTAISAFAAESGINDNENKVLDALQTTVTMSDGVMEIPDAYVNQAENYFNTIDMTAQEADDIVSIINEGKSFLEKSGAANIKDLTFDQKKELLAIGKRAVGVIGMTMSYDFTTKELTILTPDNEVAFKAVPYLSVVKSSSGGTSVVVKDDSIIKTTGADSISFAGFAVVGAVLVVVTAGSAFFLLKNKKVRV